MYFVKRILLLAHQICQNKIQMCEEMYLIKIQPIFYLKIQKYIVCTIIWTSVRHGAITAVLDRHLVTVALDTVHFVREWEVLPLTLSENKCANIVHVGEQQIVTGAVLSKGHLKSAFQYFFFFHSSFYKTTWKYENLV